MATLLLRGDGSNYFGAYGQGPTKDVKIKSVTGNRITLMPAPMLKCGANKPNLEIRRHASGTKEYVATVKSKSGNVYTVGFEAVGKGRTAPKVGESVYLYCANGGGGGGEEESTLPGLSKIFPGEEGMAIPSWVWLIGGALLLVIVLKK